MNFLQLLKRPGVEPITSWDSVCKDPDSLVDAILERTYIEKEENFDNIVFSDKVPGASERSKIWFKTSWPYAFGKVMDGAYQMDYGMSQYPVGIPFVSKTIDPLREGLRELSSAEVKEYGMRTLKTEDGEVVTTAKYYIFEPPEIRY